MSDDHPNKATSTRRAVGYLLAHRNKDQVGAGRILHEVLSESEISLHMFVFMLGTIANQALDAQCLGADSAIAYLEHQELINLTAEGGTP